jgi:hypothetical protein
MAGPLAVCAGSGLIQAPTVLKAAFQPKISTFTCADKGIKRDFQSPHDVRDSLGIDQ